MVPRPLQKLGGDSKNDPLRPQPRGNNSHADSLATLSSSISSSIPRIITVESLSRPSTFHTETTQVVNIHLAPSWIDPIVAYIKDGQLSDNRFEAEKIRRKASRY